MSDEQQVDVGEMIRHERQKMDEWLRKLGPANGAILMQTLAPVAHGRQSASRVAKMMDNAILQSVITMAYLCVLEKVHEWAEAERQAHADHGGIVVPMNPDEVLAEVGELRKRNWVFPEKGE